MEEPLAESRILELKGVIKRLTAGASYRKMLAAYEQGRPICVASAAIPVEVLYAMDVYPVFPESLAAIAAGLMNRGAPFVWRAQLFPLRFSMPWTFTQSSRRASRP